MHPSDGAVSAHGAIPSSSNLFDGCPTGTFRYCPATEEIQWSTEVYRVHGYERGEVVPSLDLGYRHIVPEFRDRARAFWLAVRTHGGPLSIYLTLLNSRGRQRQILVVADTTHQEGMVVGVQGSVIDLTRAIHLDSHRLANEAVAAAVKGRGVIDQAKGILMGHTGISAEQAFEIIRQRSQETNRKTAAIAQDIVARAAHHHDQGIQEELAARLGEL